MAKEEKVPQKYFSSFHSHKNSRLYQKIKTQDCTNCSVDWGSTQLIPLCTNSILDTNPGCLKVNKQMPSSFLFFPTHVRSVGYSPAANLEVIHCQNALPRGVNTQNLTLGGAPTLHTLLAGKC